MFSVEKIHFLKGVFFTKTPMAANNERAEKRKVKVKREKPAEGQPFGDGREKQKARGNQKNQPGVRSESKSEGEGARRTPSTPKKCGEGEHQREHGHHLKIERYTMNIFRELFKCLSL